MKKAIALWGHCCVDIVGCDQEGNETENPSKLGMVALANGLDFWWLITQEKKDAIANFLEDWAKSIRESD